MVEHLHGTCRSPSPTSIPPRLGVQVPNALRSAIADRPRRDSRPRGQDSLLTSRAGVDSSPLQFWPDHRRGGSVRPRLRPTLEWKVAPPLGLVKATRRFPGEASSFDWRDLPSGCHRREETELVRGRRVDRRWCRVRASGREPAVATRLRRGTEAGGSDRRCRGSRHRLRPRHRGS